MLTLVLFFLFLNILPQEPSFIHPRCFWRKKQNEENYDDILRYYTFYVFPINKIDAVEYLEGHLHKEKRNENYRFVLALIFSVNEVNRNPDLLPNMTLLFEILPSGCRTVLQLHICEHYYYTIRTKHTGGAYPNYHCKNWNTCTVMLSGPSWVVSSMDATAMHSLYPYQFFQLTYGPFHPTLNDSEQFPFLYQMAPEDTSLPLAMVSLILHFSWNWVGLTISDNDQGMQILSYLRTEMEKNILCFAFVNMIPHNFDLFLSRILVYYNQILTSSSNVVIIYGETDSTLSLIFRMWTSQGLQRIWVTTSQFDVTTSKSDSLPELFHGTLVFAHHHAEISGFKNFIQTVNPLKYSDEYLAGVEWMNFNCGISASMCKTLRNCSSNSSLEQLIAQTFDMAFSDDSYDIYNAVYTMAHVTHEVLLQPMDNEEVRLSKCMKMYSLLRKTHFTNPGGDRVNMNQKEKLQPEYDIFQIWNFPNGLGLRVKIGMFSPYFPHGQQLQISEDILEWATGSRQMPPSVCSADCGPGFRKFRQEGMAACCFDCSPCPENEISNETNVDQCVKCPEDQYANAEHIHCIDKTVISLTYEDPLGMALTLMAFCFTVFTAVVLGIFIKHHDTPLVKANNRNLSYTLLVSLIFCFLCPLLFIGHPNAATCMLQQITFGVVFSVAVSTVLAKTVTVLLAFKVTTPGRRMRYYLIPRASNFIIVICTLIQIILCAIWLGVSPPFIEIDAKSEQGHIIIVCSKGSMIAFYCVLGYHGSLALGSFIVAFLARNLPDTFNEAKLLTFSMLIFFSVWVTFLPVYHSTKGKVMVAVEVFSILASSAGLLGCIFIPKCYIILLRPERNSLKKLKEKASS
ncbi:vomeronasal type-2 receptor 116-like [Chionomys nivalis]|uniref:vomeronasal type-2 receptor 116-like n=1 Tax=Chionomys nivalis TaxID=269649 RepID=UPI002595A09D|nr:vomeronasal type-2 receptor 116-like [Chionomys nivalis]